MMKYDDGMMLLLLLSGWKERRLEWGSFLCCCQGALFLPPRTLSVDSTHFSFFLFPEHNQATTSPLPDYVVPGTIYPVFLATLLKLSLHSVYYVEHK